MRDAQTTLTLSGHVAKMRKVCAVKIKKGMHAQSQAVLEAVIEFFDGRGLA
ncbi:MAG: hypothetical protein ABR985_11650 [Methanotrichaceae archaeon]|jgi:hypothetical protein